ncbi:KAP family P-loop NTPase fold protein [Sphingosinicella rhizophila]|uniref:P-loop NTPase fold protein n=1 Tax=Sphingosinicella rhizophila TaxID=3050082 RepID=A0ABU3Q4N0_9SPHN|nr:P-loop NTPase fold protein [Sphingosinicella sp. GR2756]MDT9597913.1 P-loop NTPase fold protein [Sphingosinicella sp. GR2756]
MSDVDGLYTSTSGSLTADRPRTKLDEDELGYRDFAEAVAAGLAGRAGNDGLVIAIHGKWGSGKTTAVNMAVDALERREAGKGEDERTIVVRFNPWWFSEQKDLTRAFFTELTASIGKRLSAGVRDGLRTMAKKVTGAGELVSSILAWTPAGPAAKQIAELVKAAGEEIADERSLDDVRSDLAKALEKEARSIVVIIDDVDRLPGDEARQIFRLVKSVADLPRVTYLLVFDRDIATRTLERPADADSPEWLEKIIQASFDLPPVAQADLNRLFLKRLNAIVGNAPVPDIVRWGNTFHGAVVPWLRTARDVGRLANALAMAWPAVRKEVDVADFVAIETMRLFEPRLYAFVRNHGHDLTGTEPNDSSREAREEFGAVLLANVEPERRKRAERALRYLFPRLDAIFANTWHGGDWRNAERERRITSKRRFLVYFSLGLGDGIISTAEMAALRASFTDPKATRRLVQGYVDQPRRAGGTRAAVLLDALMAEVDAELEGGDEAAARALLAAADLFLNAADGDRSPEGLPKIWAVSFAIDPLLNRLDAKTIATLLSDAIDGPSPRVATFFVTIMSGEHGRVGKEEAKPKAERRLSLTMVKRLEQRLAERVARDAQSGALIQQRDAASQIWAWERHAGAEPIKLWIEANLDTVGFAPWLMMTFTGEGTAHGFGDMVGKRIHTVSRESLETFVDVDRLAAIAEQRITNGVDQDKAAKHFLDGLQARF